MSDYDTMDAPAEEVTARAGQALDAAAPPADEGLVVDALRTVYDPEIPVNIYDLGLVYDVECAAAGRVGITMTLTAPACPVAGELPQQVADTVAAVPGVGEVEVQLVWEPAWHRDMMSDDARMALDMY